MSRRRPGMLLEGRYRLVEPISKGQRVWIAERTPLKQRVMVRFRSTGGSDENAARFVREARVMASIRHRNVVDLYEVGSHQGAPFLVMEFLEGETLAERIARGPLPLRMALETAIDIGKGLEAVHMAGIIHRDVRPDTVFMAIDKDEHITVPKLLDFGIARGTNTDDLITDVGRAMGTLPYMAPEQADGQAKLDGRVDVYLLGLTLYEMLTQRVPYNGRGIPDVLRAMFETGPTPITEHRPDLPPNIAATIQSALAVDRDARPADVRELYSALEAAETALSIPPT